MTKHIHMLGICGTGMGSLALLLKEAGYVVTGSDENVYPPMSTQLEDAGIRVYSGYKGDRLLFSEKSSLSPFSHPGLVIIGNVISRGNVEAEAVLTQGIPYMSMPQAVAKLFLKDKHSIVVAGTHGKTTTANLCAWLLEAAGYNPSFLIGGVGKNFGVSARLVKKGTGYFFRKKVACPLFVIEGDEYDTAFFDKGPKFLHYRPKSVILGPIEFDHADIYKDLEHVMSSFEKLIAIIPSDGLLVACADSENTMKLLSSAKCRVVTYGLNKNAQYHPRDIIVKESGITFLLHNSSKVPCSRFHVPMFGNHNLQNTIGVLALLTELGCGPEKLVSGLKKFKGVVRRQEVRGVKRGITVIDDFAHHPTAISETITAMRQRFQTGRIFAIFEPRSNTSKRNIFQHQFAAAFQTADVAIIAEVHRPEKIPEAERLDVEKLVEEINVAAAFRPPQENGDLKVAATRVTSYELRATIKAHYIPRTDDIIEFVAREAKKGDCILIMSNGGFDNIHKKLLKRLK